MFNFKFCINITQYFGQRTADLYETLLTISNKQSTESYHTFSSLKEKQMTERKYILARFSAAILFLSKSGENELPLFS